LLGPPPVRGTNQYVGMRAISRHTTAREVFRHECFTARDWDPLLDWASGKPVTRTAILIYQIRDAKLTWFQPDSLWGLLQQMGAIPYLAVQEINLRRVASKRLNSCRTALQEVKFPTLTLRDTISRQRFASAARIVSAWPAYGTASLPSRRCAGRFVTSGQTKNVLSYLDRIARLVAPVVHARRLRLLLSENGY
jgi:hypothetical protein